MRFGLALALVTVLAAGSLAPAEDAAAPAPIEPAKIVEALKSKDKSARLAAAQQAKDVQDEKLVSPLASLVDDEDMATRHAAIEALGSRTSPEAQKKAASALAAHLPKVAKKLEDEAELIATARALGALAQPSTIDALMADIETGTPNDVVRTRLAAVANIAAPGAIDALIQFLAKQGRGQNGQQRDACRDALREATGENFGNDPDAWRSWWKDAKRTFDFDAAARRRAAEKQKQADDEKRKRERKEKKEGDGGAKKGGDDKK